MPDRPITGDDARLYIEHVGGHGLDKDIRWLIDAGRFPVGCCVLDVGCGTGALVAALVGEKLFSRSVVGVELSPELADHATRTVQGTRGSIVHGDFLSWNPPGGWQPDTAVMSFFLHHAEDVGVHLRHAASVLPHGGRLYVFDRLAIDQSALDSFPAFWEVHYRAAHEWSEDMPNLMTVDGLDAAANQAGFAAVRRQVCPHDRRAGAERFPKTLSEYWLCQIGRTFPPIMVVSPAHFAVVDEIAIRLSEAGLRVSERLAVDYSDELIRTIYERCPWREMLLRFISEKCPARKATALLIAGDGSTPELLDRLGQFKKCHRDEWQSIKGLKNDGDFRAIILPFHVAEPYEAETLARVIGITREA